MALAILCSLGDVRLPSGELGEMRYVSVPGDGWCFYTSCHLQFRMPAIVSRRVLLCAAITWTALRKAEHAAFDVADDDTDARRAYLRSLPFYTSDVDNLTSFDVCVR